MMTNNPFEHSVLWALGPLKITSTLVTTWMIMVTLCVLSFVVSRRLSVDQPGRIQSFAELLVVTISDEIRAMMNRDPTPFLPLIGTLFILILTANLSGLLPGVEAPTGALETDLALALVVLVAVVGWGVHRHGVWGYMKTYGQPNVLMLPLNLLEAVTRVISMSVRLFGNVMSGMFISTIVLAVAGLLVPIPFMALEVLVGIIQAYIFTVLAMVFIAAAASDREA